MDSETPGLTPMAKAAKRWKMSIGAQNIRASVQQMFEYVAAYSLKCSSESFVFSIFTKPNPKAISIVIRYSPIKCCVVHLHGI